MGPLRSACLFGFFGGKSPTSGGSQLLIKHQPWHSPEHSGQAWFELEWNMWRNRQHPYNLLEEGDALLTVTGGGTARGRVMSEVEVVSLAKGQYSSKVEAWDILRTGIDPEALKHFKFSKTGFLQHPYTVAAPEEGWIMAWVSYPAVIVNQPRPEELKFRPNGWAELPDSDLAGLYAGALEVDDDTNVWIYT